MWAELELLCSPQVNYKAYRAVEADAKPPFIPFIGMQLRDMVFMNDGNPVQLLNGLYKYVLRFTAAVLLALAEQNTLPLSFLSRVAVCPSCARWPERASTSSATSTGRCTRFPTLRTPPCTSRSRSLARAPGPAPDRCRSFSHVCV